MFRLLIIIIIFFFSSNLLSKEIKIISIIDNQTITNVDILKEMNYLIALNSSYKNIEQDKMLDIAKDSLINEIIKKIELKKYFKLGEKNQSIEAEINKIFNQINLNNDDKIKSYLDNFNIDTLWDGIAVRWLLQTAHNHEQKSARTKKFAVKLPLSKNIEEIRYDLKALKLYLKQKSRPFYLKANFTVESVG